MNRTMMIVACASSIVSAAMANPTIRSAAGSDAASIQAAVDAFRADVSLGGVNNGVGGGPFGIGRREINWDAAALDVFASPNLMPANFFNRVAATGAPGSPRGATFTSPGDGVMVSQRNTDPNSSSLRFGDIDPSYAGTFKVFSEQRLFAAKNSTIVDTTFTVPSQPGERATTNGFAAVFSDVDAAEVTKIELFDLNDALIFSVAAPTANNGLSFIGVTMNQGERIARVRLTMGNTALGAGVVDGGGIDLVAADDFFYGEPQVVPTPGAMALGLLGAAGVLKRRRR